MKKILTIRFFVVVFFIFVLGILIPVISLLFASLMNDASLSDGIGSIDYALQNILPMNEIEKRIVTVLGDKALLSLSIRSIVLSLSVAIIVSCFSWVMGFYVTRKSDLLAHFCLPLSLFTYLTPPAILAIAFSYSWSDHSTEFIWLKLLFSHCVYLFPISFVLSFGFWAQKPYEIDRMAAIDGAAFWERLFLHVGIKELLYMTVVGMLIFMISWNDIVFSRVLASADIEQKLLVDYIFQRLFSNAIIEAFGSLALFSFFVVMVFRVRINHIWLNILSWPYWK